MGGASAGAGVQRDQSLGAKRMRSMGGARAAGVASVGGLPEGRPAVVMGLGPGGLDGASEGVGPGRRSSSWRIAVVAAALLIALLIWPVSRLFPDSIMRPRSAPRIATGWQGCRWRPRLRCRRRSVPPRPPTRHVQTEARCSRAARRNTCVHNLIAPARRSRRRRELRAAAHLCGQRQLPESARERRPARGRQPRRLLLSGGERVVRQRSARPGATLHGGSDSRSRRRPADAVVVAFR